MNSDTARVRARLLIVLAAVLWSLSGAFTRLLREPTALHLNEPRLDAITIAFYRPIFAALFLAPTLRGRDISWPPAMAGMVCCFAAMNLSFVASMALGPAANAIWLQYTAPLWLYLAGRFWFGELATRRATAAVAIGTVGVAIIILANWGGDQAGVVGLGLISGVTYAGVLLFLRQLRIASGNWLTFLNHAGSAAVLVPVMLARGDSFALAPGQAVCLALFGTIQMGLPYWLTARSLRAVTPQEAGTLLLLEPILNPVWAYLLSPETDTVGAPTIVGASIILAALLVRYWPTRLTAESDEDTENSP